MQLVLQGTFVVDLLLPSITPGEKTIKVPTSSNLILTRSRAEDKRFGLDSAELRRHCPPW